MRARLALLLISVCLIGVGTVGCATTMQGAGQRQADMVLTEEDLPGIVLSAAALADLADIPVDQVTNFNDIDPKAEEPAAGANPESCGTFQLRRPFQGMNPKTFGLAAFHSDGAEDEDLGYEIGSGAALFTSPSMAEARFAELAGLIAPCAEYELLLDNGAPLLMQVTPLALEGLTVESVTLIRKAVVAPSLQAAGFGIAMAETYFLFRNAIVRATLKEVGVRKPDPAAMTELSVAVQQHLLSSP